jgi:hypothetical protein
MNSLQPTQKLFSKLVCAKHNYNTKFEKWWIAHTYNQGRYYSKCKNYSSHDVISVNDVFPELTDDEFVKLKHDSNQGYKLV